MNHTKLNKPARNDPTTGFRASAFLDDVRVVNNNGTNFIHADLIQVKGSFATDVDLQISDSGGTTKFENVIPLFSEIIISNGGSGYSRDDTIVIKDSKNKIVETVKIKKVSSTGQILNVEKINQVIPNFLVITRSLLKLPVALWLP